jgi:para-nitrobenzyl esterase
MTTTRAHVLSLAASLALLCCTGAAAAQEVVATRSGELRGVTSAGISSFKGIPYAAPPVGPLRWKPPQPAPRWQGVRAADRTGPACMQARNGLDPRVTISEDCLYLNVWRPAGTQPNAKLAVMVWIHGGGFIGDSASGSAYDGATLARNGVIVVTLNYRLGRFGWFAYPELTQEAGEAATANFGLMDDIAALTWVKDNIAGFGGDPNRVTLFGESAGGIAVNALMCTPATRGLFSAAITQSGFGRNPATPLDVAENMSAAFAAQVGATDLATLRNLPAERILDSTNKDPTAEPPGLIIDGKLLPANVDRLFAKGAQAKVPWIVGSNDYEASVYLDHVVNPGMALSVLPEKFRRRVVSVYDPSKTGNMDAVVAGMLTDKTFTEPARLLAARHAKSGQPVYRYFFAYVAEKARLRVPGAAHGDEVRYVFGQFGADSRLKITYTDADKRIGALVERYWTNFAKTGDPNGPGVIAWPRDKHDEVMVFGLTGAQAARRLRKAQLDLWAPGAAKP